MRLEGVLAEKTGLKDFAIIRVESVPKRSVAFFFRQVACVRDQSCERNPFRDLQNSCIEGST